MCEILRREFCLWLLGFTELFAGESKLSLDCFFFGMVSKECEKRALSLWNGTQSDLIAYSDIDHLVPIPPGFVFDLAFHGFLGMSSHISSTSSLAWKHWMSTTTTVELLGKTLPPFRASEKQKRVRELLFLS